MTTNTEQLLREAASEALLTLDGIADTNPRDRADFENKDEWITWAKSRAKWAADKLRAPISRELLAERVLKQMLEQDAALTQPAKAAPQTVSQVAERVGEAYEASVLSIATPPASPPAQAGEAAGLAVAADYIDALAEAYMRDQASAEPDTGDIVFDRGEAGRDYHNTLVELAEQIRGLDTTPPASQEQAECKHHFTYFGDHPVRRCAWCNMPEVASQEQAQQPCAVTLYASPVQLAAAMRGELIGMDTDSYRNGEFGAYLPVRHIPAGKFTQAVTLTSGQQPSGGVVVGQIVRFMNDVEAVVEFRPRQGSPLKVGDALTLAKPQSSGGEVVHYEPVSGCRECRHAGYESGGWYRCLKTPGQSRRFDDEGRPIKPPAWCPLPTLATKPEPMTEQQRGNLIMEHLGPVALAGGQMSPLDAFVLGIEATERAYGITSTSTKEPQR